MKSKYVPDLQQAAATCEANFIKLQRVFPQFSGNDIRELELYHGEQFYGTAQFEVMERFAYTTTIKLAYQIENLPVQLFYIRVYDDAHMAEIVISEQGGQLHGVYPYPNQKMYQKDEKNQLNQLLSEALTQCMAFGIVANSSLQV